jgi:hypothetical protein
VALIRSSSSSGKEDFIFTFENRLILVNVVKKYSRQIVAD